MFLCLDKLHCPTTERKGRGRMCVGGYIWRPKYLSLPSRIESNWKPQKFHPWSHRWSVSPLIRSFRWYDWQSKQIADSCCISHSLNLLKIWQLPTLSLIWEQSKSKISGFSSETVTRTTDQCPTWRWIFCLSRLAMSDNLKLVHHPALT